MNDNMDYMFKPTVLVTGFGPFLDHPLNASWEGVKLLNKEEIERKHNIDLVLFEISVTYKDVDEFIPQLWEAHTPKLMIHVGVSRLAKQLTLETQAHRKGYKRLDYWGACPENHTCTAEGAVRLHTKLNVERICKEFNDGAAGDKLEAVPSLDAGRYLCEYIYYTSLSVDNRRTLFVHVPDMDIYSSNDTARGLEKIIDLCLQQLKETDDSGVTEKQKDSSVLEDNQL